jgi:hypothetical protein
MAEAPSITAYSPVITNLPGALTAIDGIKT